MAWSRRLDFISIQSRLASQQQSQVMLALHMTPDPSVRESGALDGVKWKKHLREGKGQGGEVRRGSLQVSAVVNLEGFQATDGIVTWVGLMMNGSGQEKRMDRDVNLEAVAAVQLRDAGWVDVMSVEEGEEK